MTDRHRYQDVPADFDTVLEELHGLPPAESTATRDARARRARDDGDRELAGARGEAGSRAGELASARSRWEDLARRRDELRAELDAVEAQLDAAAPALRTAERARLPDRVPE